MGFLNLAIVLLGAAIVVLMLVIAGIELQYRRRLGNKLELTVGTWRLDTYEPNHYRLVGDLELVNRTRRLEVMVPEIHATVKLLSSGSLAGITTQTQMIPRYPQASPREDGYWEGHIVKTGDADGVEVEIDIHGDELHLLNVAWIALHYITYGPEGHLPKVCHIVVPLRFPDPMDSKNWRSASNAEVLPIRTHLLTQLDDPLEVVRRYVLPHAQPGDVVTIGESPIAIMQGTISPSRRHQTRLGGSAIVLPVHADFQSGDGLRTASAGGHCGRRASVCGIPAGGDRQAVRQARNVLPTGWRTSPLDR